MFCKPLLASTLRFFASETVLLLLLLAVAVEGTAPMPLCGDTLLPAEVLGTSAPNTDSELTTTVSVKFEVVNFCAIASLVEIIVVGELIGSFVVLLSIAEETVKVKFNINMSIVNVNFKDNNKLTNYWRN